VVLMVTQIYANDLLGQRCGRPLPEGVVPGQSSHIRSDCRTIFSNSDYLKVFITSVAEWPGLFFAGLCIFLTGRRNTITLMFSSAALGILLLLCCTSRVLEVVFLGWARAFLHGSFQSLYIYTPEVYPTTIRALGLGVCSSFARIGGMVTPFVAGVLSNYSVNAAILLYGVMVLAGGILAQFLKKETKGQKMPDTKKDVTV